MVACRYMCKGMLINSQTSYCVYTVGQNIFPSSNNCQRPISLQSSQNHFPFLSRTECYQAPPYAGSDHSCCELRVPALSYQEAAFYSTQLTLIVFVFPLLQCSHLFRGVAYKFPLLISLMSYDSSLLSLPTPNKLLSDRK